ncbi:MAG: alcohol dehydrogenase catalytic domain-containing protein [Spirochaetales bacterium]|nr:alcohol dehydrogenase catalytic domain-containing protein [Spirochaetales bacterium]
MQQLTLVKRGILEWREVHPPVLSEQNAAIVRPLAVARCDLDIPMLRAQTLFRPPFPIGHEFAAEIVELTPDLSSSFHPGQRVAVSFQVACGSCPSCSAGLSRACESIPGAHDFGMGAGGRSFGGALSDLVHVPHASHMLLPLPDETDLIAVASLSDNISEAFKLAGFHLKSHPGIPLLIAGGHAGSIGLYTAGLAIAMGSPVLYLDSDSDRLEIAVALGAEVEQIREYPGAWTKKFPLVVDATGQPDGYRFCLRSAAVEGLVTSASIFFSNDFPLPYMDLYVTGATVKIGRVDSRETMPEALKWIQSGKFKAGNVVTKVVNWKDAKEAWLEPTTKLVVTR